VLDVGCGDGALFRRLGAQLGPSAGIDSRLREPQVVSNARLAPGTFPRDVPDRGPFDVITMLAVLEHLGVEECRRLSAVCAALLVPGGRLLITVPSGRVDAILKLLKALRVVDGMALEEHHGFDPRSTPQWFPPDSWRLVRHTRFELGLNHLFVFERVAAGIQPPAQQV
jgi:2-polyprenyl-3-methyl-5-hydroxy-6-metoxy-1,4-benzoquinol methylase